MARVLQLKDGSVHTCLDEKDFYDLIEERMGHEARDYVSELIEDTALLVQESADERYEELEAKYEALKEQYDDLKDKYERGCW